MKRLFIAAIVAVFALTACNNELKWKKLDQDEAASRIEQAVAKAAADLSPANYSEAINMFADLVDNFKSMSGEDAAPLTDFFMNLEKDWTKVEEKEGEGNIVDVTSIITVHAADVKGHYTIKDGKVVCDKENTADFKITYPARDGLSATIRLDVKDSKNVLTVKENNYSKTGDGKKYQVKELTRIAIPKNGSISFTKNGKNLLTAVAICSSSIASDSEFGLDDKVSVTTDIKLGADTRIVAKRVLVSAERMLANVTVLKGANKVLSLKGEIYDNILDREKKKVEIGKVSAVVDLEGDVQLYVEANANELNKADDAFQYSDSDDSFAKAKAEAYNKYLDAGFYFDGYKKNVQGKVVTLVEKDNDGDWTANSYIQMQKEEDDGTGEMTKPTCDAEYLTANALPYIQLWMMQLNLLTGIGGGE